jgi:hypothetical protein
MTRDEYEQSKARIQEQHRAAVELMDTACKAQLRALDLVWMVQGQGGAGGEALAGLVIPAAPPPAKQEEPKKPRRKSSPEVAKDVVAVVGRLPEKFTRHDVIKLLGYEPERGALFRALKDVIDEGHIRVEQAGSGQVPAIYRRNPKKSPAQT